MQEQGEIFLRKILRIITLLSVFATTGCAENISNSVPAETVLQTTGIITEAVITEPAPEKLVTVSENKYIYDNAKILSQEESDECNKYAGWINSKLMLNTAVVTANKLNGLSPEQYAEKCYNDIFQGMGSGMIILINNDTNKDYIYKHGTVSAYITEKTEKDAFFYATKSIVSGDYKSGITELLSLAENCPKHIFDNGNAFSDEQIMEFESTLEMRSDTNAFIITTNNITEKSNADLSKDFYKRYSGDEKGFKMLYIDKKLSEVLVADDSGIKNSDEITKLIKANDYYGAVNAYFKTIGITPEISS